MFINIPLTSSNTNNPTQAIPTTNNFSALRFDGSIPNFSSITCGRTNKAAKYANAIL